MKRLAGALLLTTTFAAGAAHAEPVDQRAAAQALFDRGRDLARHKNFAEACPKFAESQRLDPGLGTMLWLADCWENDGRTASAWALFKEAAAVAAAQHDPREGVARRRVATLEPKLSRIVLATPTGSDATPGLVVQRDGIPTSPAELGVALPVDPGVHTISASAPGRWPWTANLVVRPQQSEALVVTIPVLARVEAAPASVATAKPAAAQPTASTDPSHRSPQRIAGITIAAVGVAGIATGAFLGLRAKSALDDSNADGHCLADDRCDAFGKQRRSDALANATASTIAFGAGAALAVGGAVLFLTAPIEKRTGILVVPTIGKGDAAVVVARRF